MTTLPNLGAHTDGGHIVQSQSQKEVTSNALDDLLDNSNNRPVTVMVSTSSPVVVSADDFTGNVKLKLVAETGSPGGPESGFTLQVPATNRVFIVDNTTEKTATVDVSGGANTTVDVATNEVALIQSDGTDFVKVAASLTPYDVGFFVSGVPVFDAVSGLFTAVRDFTIPESAAGSQAYADTPPASGETDKVFDIQKNSASIGSATFPSLSNTGTFVFSSSISFASGDRLSIVNPANPSPSEEETAIANISIVLRATA